MAGSTRIRISFMEGEWLLSFSCEFQGLQWLRMDATLELILPLSNYSCHFTSHFTSLVPRPSPPSSFDRLQQFKIEPGKGLGTRLSFYTAMHVVMSDYTVSLGHSG